MVGDARLCPMTRTDADIASQVGHCMRGIDTRKSSLIFGQPTIAPARLCPSIHFLSVGARK